MRLGPELYPRSTRRKQRTATFSEFRGGRPMLRFLTIFVSRSTNRIFVVLDRITP